MTAGALFALVGIGLSHAHAADAAAGRQKVAGVCQACHGMDGLSKNPEAPNLAGQIENYLAKSIAEYRSGERKNEAMNIVTKDLNDADHGQYRGLLCGDPSRGCAALGALL